ncbi:MAG: STAS domain-containing protein [Calditrichaeota bacterium]|nr:MAG: STAS domain-containing protein [Calditrichota bacterium]
MKLFSNVKGDIMGGITTAVIALPWSIAFGIVAFAPLGEQYVGQGALAGIYGLIIAGILTSLLGGTQGQISLPTALMAVMTTSIIATLLKNPEITALGENEFAVILLFVSITIFIAGLIQLILGASGGGKLVKFIPYPVIAGFMNGIAIIIFLGQLRPIFGVPKDTALMAIFTGQAGFRYDTLAVGVVTIVTMLGASKVTKAIPSSLVGLLCGMATYFAIGNLFNPELLKVAGNKLIIGPVPSAFPTPKQIGNFFKLLDQIPLHLISKLIVPALTLAILASIDTLLTSVVTDMVTRSKHNSSKELFGQGITNLTCAAFGSLPAAGSTLHTLVNINSGGRTALAGIVNSVTVLIVVLFFGSLVQWIPMAVLAAILLITAFSMIESESIHLSLKKSALGNLLVIVAVTAITVAVDLIIAVLVGLVITAFLFIKEQVNKTIVRRMYTGNLIHSKKVRSQEAMRILEEKGHLIKVYELNGSLFFGTCDKLLAEIDKEIDNSFCIIFDMKRVHTIDLTGAQLLKQIVDRIHEKNHYLLLSYLEIPGDQDKMRMRRLMEDVGVIETVGKDFIFPDTDHAQEWAEDALIQQELEAAQVEKHKLALSHLNVFKDLTPEQLKKVRKHLHPQRYNKSDIVFKEGDPGDKIYFILSGGVSVLARISTNGRDRRLATFGEGVFFGDMAILEDKPRSATVKADTETEVLYMSVDDFRKLVETEPLLASKMLLGMARELSYRLRLTTIEVRTLEE